MQLITQSYFERAEPSAPSPQSSDVCVVWGGDGEVAVHSDLSEVIVSHASGSRTIAGK